MTEYYPKALQSHAKDLEREFVSLGNPGTGTLVANGSTASSSMAGSRVAGAPTSPTTVSVVYNPPEEYPEMEQGALYRYLKLEGKDYGTADLVRYLHSPGAKVVPHTKQPMSERQAQNVLTLVAAGIEPIYVDRTSDAAYSLPTGVQLDDSQIIALREYIAQQAARQDGLATDQDMLLLALQVYTDTLATMLGDYYRTKPMVNFSVARFVNEVADGSPMGEDLEVIRTLLTESDRRGVISTLMSRHNLSPAEAEEYVHTWSEQKAQSGATLTPHLSDQEFLIRAAAVDPQTLRTIMEEASIIGSGAARPLVPYALSSKDLASGEAVMPPLGYSVLDHAIRAYGYDNIRLPATQPRSSQIHYTL